MPPIASRSGTSSTFNAGRLWWIHPLAFERDKDLAELRKKGKQWTEAEKQWLLDTGRWPCSTEVVPLHRELADPRPGGTDDHAFLSPILPLLLRQALARQAMPNVCCRSIWKATARMPRCRFAGRRISRSAVASRAACGPRKVRYASR